MSNFDVIKDANGKEHLIFDSSELYDDKLIGNKPEDYEYLTQLGEGAFGKVYKVRSKANNKIYAMKKLNIEKLRNDSMKAFQLALNETSFLEGLSHPRIIKYYKNFYEGNFLYLIIEFVENGDMKGYIEANKIFSKHIPEEDLWNIFLQCMEALSYVHSMGVIHRDIKPANILVTNNMAIKLGDFGVSALKNKGEDDQYINANYNMFKNQSQMQYHGTFVGTRPYMAKEMLDENEYDQKVDVYSMGVSFFEMCYYHIPKKVYGKRDQNGNNVFIFTRIVKDEDKNVHYSKELLDIIELMLEEDKDKRKTSKDIYEMIRTEYFKRYVRNSSIDSIVRCLYSCNELTNNFLNYPNQQINNKPFTYLYIKCLKSITEPNIESWINSINYFRQELLLENQKLQGTKEIEPRFVFAFLLKQLHKELNFPQDTQNKANLHLIISGEEESKTSKVEMMLQFINDYLSKINSIISNSFLGLMKETFFCNFCKIKTYQFSSYFFVTFDIEKMTSKNNNTINELDIVEQFAKQNRTMKKNELYCSKCLNKTNHSCYKQFYSVPNNLIFSIQRGVMNKHKTPVKIEENLDLSKDVEFQFCKKHFTLVGFLGSIIKNGNESFFSVIRFNNAWYNCEGTNIQKISSPSNYKSNGDILMLFYNAIN